MQIKKILLILVVLLCGCNKMFKDEELLLSKTPYLGDELRIDGYYYRQLPPDKYNILFLYRDGIMIYYICFLTDLQQIEDRIPSIYEEIKNSKLRWGVFVISDYRIQYSGWGTSVGGGLPTYKSIGIIENDTTFHITKDINSDGREFEVNEMYHFRQFSPKPDSTNNFIK